jgi:hypothetical protein
VGQNIVNETGNVALGSFIEGSENEVIVLRVTGEHVEFKLKFEHNFPATKLRWHSDDLLLTSGKNLCLHKYDAEALRMTKFHEFTPTAATFLRGPQMSFDYHELTKHKVGKFHNGFSFVFHRL